MFRHALTQIALTSLFACIATSAAADDEPAHCRYQNIGSFSFHVNGDEPTIDGIADDNPVHLLLSTNSSATMITRATAEKLKLPLKHTDLLSLNISGEVPIYHAVVHELSFGKVKWHHLTLNVPYGNATYVDPDMDGWIGADFLFSNDVEIELAKNSVKFFSPDHCDDAHLAYWDENATSIPISEIIPINDTRQFFEVEINGHPVRATISTSSQFTIINRKTAEQLGVSINAKDSSSTFKAHGPGQHEWEYWVGQFKSLKIGDETINNPKFIIADFEANPQLDTHHMISAKMLDDEPQLRLGMDFLRAHHVLLAVSQRKMYFSYLGGPVFGPYPVAKQAAPGAAQSDSK